MNDITQPDAELATLPSGLVPHEQFAWRNRKNITMPIGTMDTPHLFQTVKMIWNNFVPPSYRIGTVKLYRFPPFYTNDYMRQAVTSMVAVLQTRQDLSDFQKECLQRMFDILTDFQKKLEAQNAKS